MGRRDYGQPWDVITMSRTHSEELAANLIGERLGVCPSVLDVHLDCACNDFAQFRLVNAHEICIDYECSPAEYYRFGYPELGCSIEEVTYSLPLDN